MKYVAITILLITAMAGCKTTSPEYERGYGDGMQKGGDMFDACNRASTALAQSYQEQARIIESFEQRHRDDLKVIQQQEEALKNCVNYDEKGNSLDK